jgi:hypothetical protein
VNKKEAKKTLVVWVRGGDNARAPDLESFLLLFFKKEALPSLPLSLIFARRIERPGWISNIVLTIRDGRDFFSRRAVGSCPASEGCGEA